MAAEPETLGNRELQLLFARAREELRSRGLPVDEERDAGERERGEALRAGQSQVLEAIAKGVPLEQTLTLLVRLVEAQAKGMLCSVLLLDEEGKHIRHGAAPSLPRAYVELIDGAAIGPRAGSCGTAMFTGQPVIVTDIQTDPLWEDYRAAAEPYGLRACWSVPLFSSRAQVLGSFAMYYRGVRSPSQAELELLASCSHLAGIAIERHTSEGALRQSERRRHLALEAGRINTFEWELRTDRVRRDANALEVIGLGVEGTGRAYFEAVHPEDREGLQEVLASLGPAEPAYSTEYRLLRPNGRLIWLEDMGRGTFDERGELERVTGVVVDVTERRRAEQSRRQSLELLQAVIEGTSDGIFVKDREDRLVMCNSAVAQLLDRTPQDLIGRRASELLSPQEALAMRERDERIMEDEATQTFEETLQTPNAGQRTLFTTKSPWRDLHGDVIGVIGVTRDVTDQRRMEEQLRQAQKMEAVGRLAGGIAHDFNNLLTIITGYGEMLLLRVAETDSSHELARHIVDAGRRAASLTSQLLAFSRRQVLRPVVLSLNEVVVSVEPMLRRLIGEHIELVTSLEEAPWQVSADQGQLEQVLVNLAVNGRDAMPEGGRLEIATVNVLRGAAEEVPEIAPGAYVRLTVRDSGEGMSDEVRARIFEPFFTTKEMGKGTGLGLATVYGIVKQSGGCIDVISYPGRGTLFQIDLPRTVRSASADVPTPPRSEPSRACETLLVVEDEEGVRELACRVLGEHGYTILAARHGLEALELCRTSSGPIDLLLTDLVMPEMGGQELARRLARERPGIKVLYMSGYRESSHLAAEVAERLLCKPFTPLALERAVREALG